MVANPQRDDLHGIYMTEEAFEGLLRVESPYRYELVDGVVYDMTGSTPVNWNHNPEINLIELYSLYSFWLHSEYSKLLVTFSELALHL